MDPNLSPGSKQARTKIKLNLHLNSPQTAGSLQIQKSLFKMAINQSYTKAMAQSDIPLQPEQLLTTVADFVCSFIPSTNINKELQQNWCIVAFNEEALHSTESNMASCHATGIGNLQKSQQKLKLYQLFIGIGSKQLRFTSLQNYKNRFTVNLDTIEVKYLETFYSKSNRITLQVDQKYLLDFYINVHTLPFQYQQYFSPAEVQKKCQQIYKRIDKIIRNSIESSKGKIYHLSTKDIPEEEFYYNRYATEQQFAKYCQTGDVLLFRDNHTMAKVQRFITNSECDHIGVVFRDQKYGLCIFQSNSGTGVSLAMWSQLIRYKWFQNIQGIYWRRLNMQNRPQHFDQKFREFVKVNLHKQYGFSLGKLLKFKEIIYEKAEDEKNRTYFCSQLVAALYKYLNILEDKKASSTYLPKDFTDKGSLNMINNTALEAERKLIFNLSVLKQNYHLKQ